MNTEREERLQRYLDERMPPEERHAFEEELVADPDLMAAAYDEITVRDALKESAAAGRIVALGSRPERRRWALPFLAVATAASIAFLVFVLPRPIEKEIFRGDPASAPSAVEPVGDISTPPVRFVWTSDPSALKYRLEVFETAGGRRFVATTDDTFLVPGLEFEASAAGYWRATSLDSIGVGVQSTGRVDFRLP